MTGFEIKTMECFRINLIQGGVGRDWHKYK